MKASISRIIPAALLVGCWHGSAQAPSPAERSAADPPGRVARIGYITGPVSFKAAGTDDWVRASLNRPLTTGDQLWTDQDARVELTLGQASLRLDARSSLEILNLDDRIAQIKLSIGRAQVRLRRLDEQEEFEIDTPQAAVSLLRTGEYRIEAGASGGETEVVVRTGQVEASAPAQAFSVRAGQRARITGTETINYEITAAPPFDPFDDFCQTRDRRTEKAESLQHVSPNVIGWEDLDEYGSWRVHASYGPVWAPRVIVPGWAPYRFGHWVWIEPWGWTWIDDAPWGFAPFHYGRWVVLDGVWVWIPGPVRVRAIYAPALVVFVGGGPGLHYHFGIGVGLGVAWFPLGPREVYIPPYRASRVYVTNVNISHTTIVNTTNIWRTDVTRQRYVNRSVNGAVTAVPEDVFVGARPVGRAAVHVSPREAAETRIGGSAPPVSPTRRSIAARVDSETPAARPPDAARRQVTTRRTPAPSAVPFERQRPALDRDPGRPPDPRRIEDLRREQPQPAPQNREVRPPSRSSEAPPPAARSREATPVRERPQNPGQQSTRQTEDRRRTIEREHQRTDSRPAQREGSKGRGQ